MEILFLALLIIVSAYNFQVAQKIKRDNTYLSTSERISLFLSERQLNSEMFSWYKDRMLSPEKRKNRLARTETMAGLSAFSAILVLLGIILKQF